ncbi:unnamed protein product [Cuscuta campestris]|uniref:Retrotransposon gag domain-containing protein n=1 Tax=Cuscuta campestris TaxID=132261 RepID=A0A484L040_9ASTE|nr:unnamed protein product [Cuscuta campestris]
MSDDIPSSQPGHKDERIDTLQHTMHQMQHDLEAKFARLEALVLANRPPLLPTPNARSPGGAGDSSSTTPSHLPKPKLEAPKTDGSDPLRWLYKVQEYFAFYETPVAERLRCVTLMLEGPAADWFRWRMNGKLITGWLDFMEQFKLRFDPLHYVDYFGQLVKLRQRGSVLDYQTDFEKILQHVTGASEANLVSLFHSGLKSHLQHEIAILAPKTLADSFALARELEAKHNALLQVVPPRLGSWSVSNTSRVGNTRPGPTSPGTVSEDKPPLATPIRRLTRAEKLEKDAKGLCYNCDQRWTKGRKVIVVGACGCLSVMMTMHQTVRPLIPQRPMRNPFSPLTFLVCRATRRQPHGHFGLLAPLASAKFKFLSMGEVPIISFIRVLFRKRSCLLP